MDRAKHLEAIGGRDAAPGRCDDPSGMTGRTDPHFSVVMPALNAVDTVRAAIASVLRQTTPSFELIVVDDGSTDGTADVVQRTSDPRVRLVREITAGAASARNAGHPVVYR